MLLILAHILNSFRKLQSFGKREKGMDIDSDDETSYTTQYQEVLLKHVANGYCTKHRHVPLIKPKTVPSNNVFTSATASGSRQSSFDPYDISSDNEEYLTPNNVAETTPGRSDCTARLSTAARLYLNSLPGSPKNGGQVNPNLYDCHTNPMKISSTLLLPDITDWWG